MPKKIEEKLHILSPYRGYLAPVNIMGPIVHPLVVEKSIVAKILMSGAEVYEYIPHTKQTLKLTLANINNPKRHSELNEKVIEVTPVTVAPVTRTGVPTIEPEVKAEEVTAPVVEEPTTSTEVEESTAPAEVEESATPADNDDATEEESEIETDNETETQQPATTFEFEYNEDGTIDENKIEWSKYSKNQRKEIRAQINQHNASLGK